MSKSIRHLISFLLPLGAGFAVWYYFFDLPKLVQWERAVFWFPERFDYENHYVNSDPTKPARFHVSEISPEPERFLRQQFVMDDEAKRTFQNDPPSAANWAYLLDKIRNMGSDSIVVSHPLSWVDADEISLRALEHELSTFRYAAVAIDLGASPQARELPPYLESSVIPYSGDISHVPEVNCVINPPSVKASRYGFRFVENDNTSRPLLVRWEDKLLPSIELAYLISRHGSLPEIMLGKQIACGAVLPIDKAGRYQIPDLSASSESAATLMTSKKPLSGLTVISAADAPVHLTHLSEILAHQASRVPREESAYRFLGCYLGLPALALFLLFLQSRKVLLILPFLALPPAFAVVAQRWTPLSPFLIALLVFLLLPRKKKTLPPPTSTEAPRLPKKNLHRKTKRPARRRVR